MKRFIVFFIIFVFIQSINAIENKFGWSIGDWGISYDFINRKPIQQFELLRFNWLVENKFGLGFTLFEIQNSNENTVSYSMIPIEFSYNPWNYKNFIYLSFYGRLGWQFIQTQNAFQENMFTDFFSKKNDIYGTIGARLFLFPSLDLYYASYIAVFFEYSTPDRLKLGFSLDLGAIIAGILTAWKNDVDKERANVWEEKPDRDRDRIDKPK
jgi:hypothetical protein